MYRSGIFGYTSDDMSAKVSRTLELLSGSVVVAIVAQYVPLSQMSTDRIIGQSHKDFQSDIEF